MVKSSVENHDNNVSNGLEKQFVQGAGQVQSLGPEKCQGAPELQGLSVPELPRQFRR